MLITKEMPRKPEEPKKIELNDIVRTLWGAILPSLIGPLRNASSSFSEKIPSETIRNIIASLIGAGAQIFEKKFRGVHFEILSDIFEQIAGGIKSSDKGEKVKKESLPSLSKLEAIAKSKDTETKRKLLLVFSSEKHHEIIKSLTAEQVDEFINVLINLEKTREGLEEAGIKVDTKDVWQMTKICFEETAKVLGKGIQETAKFLKDNLPKIVKIIDGSADKLADKLEKIRQQLKKWRPIQSF